MCALVSGVQTCALPILTQCVRRNGGRSVVEAATLARDGSPPITRITIPTCRAHYPGGSSGCARRLLPRSCCLPLISGGSASASSLSRPAQASHSLRPAGSLTRPRRPLSRSEEHTSELQSL